jgi:hypothetical protein
MPTIIPNGSVFHAVARFASRPACASSPAAAYDPRRHDATFLIAGAPAARAGDAAEAIPAATARATFGRPTRSYRFDGFTIEAWNVNLLTKMHG